MSPTSRATPLKHTRFQLVIDLNKVTDGQYTSYTRTKLLKLLSDIKFFDNRVALQDGLLMTELHTILFQTSLRQDHFPLSSLT